MKTWQKILATVGIVFVMCALDVVRKANGVVLGGLPTMIFYGVFLAAIGFVWKLKPPKEDKGESNNKEAALARKILHERERERKRNEKLEAKAAQLRHEEELRSLSDGELEQIIQGDTAGAQDKQESPLTTNIFTEKPLVALFFIAVVLLFAALLVCAN